MKDNTVSKITEELESLKRRESQSNTKAISEAKRLKQELDQVKDRYGKQVGYPGWGTTWCTSNIVFTHNSHLMLDYSYNSLKLLNACRQYLKTYTIRQISNSRFPKFLQ